jgi:hypothetical protein
MALIQNLKEGFKERISVHDDADATFYILEFPTGKRILQIDSVGRKTRKIPGKVSQSIQLSPKAIKQLKEILKKL